MSEMIHGCRTTLHAYPDIYALDTPGKIITVRGAQYVVTTHELFSACVRHLYLLK